MVSQDLLQKVLQAQLVGTTPLGEKRIVSRAIYGGGVDSVEKISTILFPKNPEALRPQAIIVGNISEQDVSITYRMVEKVKEANE